MLKKIKLHYVGISILCLSIIFIAQFYLFYTSSSMGYLFDLSKNRERNNSYNTVYSLALSTVKDYLNDVPNSKTTLLYSDKLEGYQGNLYFVYSMWYMYPLDFTQRYQYQYNIEAMDKDYLSEMLAKDKFTHIIILGKGVEFNNLKTDYEFNFFEVKDPKNNEMDLVYGFDLNLYNIYSIFKQKGITKDFFNNIAYIEKTAVDYYDLPSAKFLYDFAKEAYENKDYEIAERYYLFYIKNFNELDGTANISLGNIYNKNGDNDKAIYYFKACLRSPDCDFKEAQKNIDILDK